MGSIQGSNIMQVAIVLALAVAAAVAEPVQHHGHHAAHHAPELLCRDTNTSIYAEVCVPAFAEQVTPVTLAVKEVVDNDYCFDRVLTICEETNTVVQREICTYVYEREDVVTDCPSHRPVQPCLPRPQGGLCHQGHHHHRGQVRGQG